MFFVEFILIAALTIVGIYVFVCKVLSGKMNGGNGAVYDVELEEKDDLGFPVVAKFFEYSGDDKEKRYNSVNCNRK